MNLDALLLVPHDGVEAPTLDAFALACGARLDELGLTDPMLRATAAGALARCVGHAFVGGYREALQALVPSLPRGAFAALCATEAGGGHPRAIQTTVTARADGALVLRGEKRWSTAAGGASRLLVVASEGQDEQGRNRLAVVEVGAGQPGVTMEAMPAPPFAPEVPHYEVRLDDAVVEATARLPGDGYERYLKPFRTLEDLHVTASLCGYMAAEAARLRLGTEAPGELLALLAALRELARRPAAPATHLGLAGALRQLRALIERLDGPWSRADAAGFARWQRDRVLLSIAEKARSARSEAAWRAVAGEG